MRTAVITFLAAVLSPGLALAITCVDQFQYSAGRWIATPFCEDLYLASVAREYGARLHPFALLDNPNKKVRICDFIGFDHRVQSLCTGYRNGDGHPR